MMEFSPIYDQTKGSAEQENERNGKGAELTCFTMKGSSATLKGSVKIVRKPFLFPYTTSVKGRSPTCHGNNCNDFARTETKERKHVKKIISKQSHHFNLLQLPLLISRIHSQNAFQLLQLFQLVSSLL